MKTVLLPVDFSETSLNAAEYAVQLLSGSYSVNLVLYTLFENPGHTTAVQEKMDNLKKALFEKGTVRMEVVCEQGDDFIGHLTRTARRLEADLVIMGVSGKGKLAQTFVGSNTLKMAEQHVCPVLIIPPAARYSGLKNVALTSDFKNVAATTPADTIKNILKHWLPTVHIVNVDPEHYISITDEYNKEKEAFSEMFERLNPQFYFIGLYSFVETITQFTADQHIDMIITMPREHSWFSAVMGGSNTRKLVYESNVPVLTVYNK